MNTIIIFIAILSLLVFVHEGGHFLAARWAGIKVYEFALGFPPRLVGWYRDPKTGKRKIMWGKGKDGLKETIVGQEATEDVGTTVYTINWLPLGGFVRIKGENGEHASDPDSFAAKPAWKRIVVLCAGVAMNFLLAAVVFGIGFMIGLPADSSLLEDPRAILVEEPQVLVQQVQAGSPADVAGLDFGDMVLAVDGEPVETSAWLSTYIKDHGDQEIVFTVLRDGEETTARITPEILEGLEDAPRIGALLGDAAIIRYPWHIAIVRGFAAAVTATLGILFSFYVLVKQLFLGNGLVFDVAGPVGIASIVGDSARLGISYLLNITAMISLSLAVINILPIPALDGGRVLFVIIEKIIRKPVPMKYEQLAHTIGFVVLMGLVVIVTWRDIVGLF